MVIRLSVLMMTASDLCKDQGILEHGRCWNMVGIDML